MPILIEPIGPEDPHQARLNHNGKVPYALDALLEHVGHLERMDYHQMLADFGFLLRANYAPNVKICPDRFHPVGEVLGDLYRSSPNLRTIREGTWLVGPGYMPVDVAIWHSPRVLAD